MQAHVLEEPVRDLKLHTSVVPTTAYGKLHQCSSHMPICLRNLSAHPTMIPKEVTVGTVAPANWVSPVTPQWELK